MAVRQILEKTAASAPTQGNNTVTESSTQEPTEEPTEDTKIEIQADSLDALEEGEQRC